MEKEKRPLKRIKLGFEAEFLILDDKGKPSNKADLFLEKIGFQKDKLGAGIRKESGKNMIEVGSYPSPEIVDTAKTFIKNLRKLLQIAEKEKLALCPLGTYPGKFIPQMRIQGYEIAHTLFGRKFRRAGRVFGYHCHYALPKGVFDKEKLHLKMMINSKTSQTLLDGYNFLIAVDPALTLFMQSSPFYQGYHFAKDSRVIIYRRDEILTPKNPPPLDLNLNSPPSKILPPYQYTLTDLLKFIENLYQIRVKMCKKIGIDPKYRSVLIPNWTPVKVNIHGTLEQRGMDMNLLLNILSVSYLLKVVLKKIQEDFFKVKVTERGIRYPFKLEEKNILIPPYSYVRETLQRKSVFLGFESELILNYSKRLLNLAQKLAPSRKEILLEPLLKMIKERKSLSDKILASASKLGWKEKKKELPLKIAQQISLEYSRILFKEIILAQKFIGEIY